MRLLGCIPLSPSLRYFLCGNFTCICMYVCMYMHMHRCPSTYTCIYIYIYIYIYMHTLGQMFACRLGIQRLARRRPLRHRFDYSWRGWSLRILGLWVYIYIYIYIYTYTDYVTHTRKIGYVDTTVDSIPRQEGGCSRCHTNV